MFLLYFFLSKHERTIYNFKNARRIKQNIEIEGSGERDCFLFFVYYFFSLIFCHISIDLETECSAA